VHLSREHTPFTVVVNVCICVNICGTVTTFATVVIT